MGNIQIADFAGAARQVATKVIGGIHFQNTDPPISTRHYITDGTDSINIVASAAYLRAVRAFNTAGVAIFVKFHDTAGVPTPGVTAVAFAVGVQATLSNPDPRLSGGGLFFPNGIGMTVVQEAADAGATAVAAGILIEVEYEQYA